MIPSDIDSEILQEIVKAIRQLGGDLELTAPILSWGDTLADEEVLSLVRAWNERGPRRGFRFGRN